MPTLVCVPMMVPPLPEWSSALLFADQAKAAGADLVEYRLDEMFSGSGDAAEERAAVDLVARSPLPCIVTCRPTWEGGGYDGDDTDRVSLFERLGTAEHPPAYIDFELAAYTRSANLRQKVNLAVQHPKQQRDVRTRLILSLHDFDGRPPDLSRKLAAAYDEPAASIVKVAYRARSLRDNLELFEILRSAPKPTIALGMGEFGLMSRVLAPKFGGFLTFASLSDSTVTAPGQPTVRELLETYRFRSINVKTRVFGVMGWPVSHSLGPAVHNAAFDAAGVNGVYLPMPIAGVERVASQNATDDHASLNATSFAATCGALTDDDTLDLHGASVTLPHKPALVGLAHKRGWSIGDGVGSSANTLVRAGASWRVEDTDWAAVRALLEAELASELRDRRVCVVGTGGVARSLGSGLLNAGARVVVVSRDGKRASSLAHELANAFGVVAGDYLNTGLDAESETDDGVARIVGVGASDWSSVRADVFINATPIGMSGGPDPSGLAVPIDQLTQINKQTVFMDTVYAPIDTPMLIAARERGCRTITGLEMFIGQAVRQFSLWTDRPITAALVAAYRAACDRAMAERTKRDRSPS